MLRAKPTSIALTGEDLCYHLDRIVSRSSPVAAWYHQDQSSGSSGGSGGGSSDDDGIFYNSDFPSDSDCEDAQSHGLSDGSSPESYQRSDGDYTSTGHSPAGAYRPSSSPDLRYQQRRSDVMYRPSAVQDTSSKSTLLCPENDCEAIVGSLIPLRRSIKLHVSDRQSGARTPCSHLAHSLSSNLQLALPCNSNCKGLREFHTNQGILPSQLQTFPLSSQQKEAVLDNSLARLSPTTVALFWLSRHTGVKRQPGTFCVALLPPSRNNSIIWINPSVEIFPLTKNLTPSFFNQTLSIPRELVSQSKMKQIRLKKPKASPRHSPQAASPGMHHQEAATRESSTEVSENIIESIEEPLVFPGRVSRSGARYARCGNAARGKGKCKSNARSNNQLAPGNNFSPSIGALMSAAPAREPQGAIVHQSGDLQRIPANNDALENPVAQLPQQIRFPAMMLREPGGEGFVYPNQTHISPRLMAYANDQNPSLFFGFEPRPHPVMIEAADFANYVEQIKYELEHSA